MPCGDHTGPLGLGPGTGRLFSRGYSYHVKNASDKRCKGYGFRHLYDILELNDFENSKKDDILKILKNYLKKTKDLQHKIEEKIKSIENSDNFNTEEI